MSKILKNQTTNPVSVSDTGITIIASGQYTIPPQDYDLWSASNDIIDFIGNLTIIVNNGAEDLDISDGVRLIQDNFSNAVDVTILDQNASQVPVTPSGNLTSTDVQSALEELQSDIDSSTYEHGNLLGLVDDDHPQYLNESRHDSLPNDNPHGVTKAQVGLGSVPNVDATDRANHTGTQLANTISDFAAQVAIDETTTSLSLSSNILTYTDEDGVATNIDLSLYLDDTNLSRIVSGVLNPTTGIVTFTRDDSSTFTIDFSPLLDNQTASEVAVTPSGNLSSTNVQAGLVELQGDIDSINSAQATQDTNISNNASAITTLQLEQTTQNTNISTNASNILALQSSQTTQDTAIALNTAKVSASGSIDTHSDVDTTTAPPVAGSQLTWDGSNWVPQSIDNGFTIFPIWAEENGNLSNNNSQWSFGNGATGFIGVPMGIACELFAISINADSPGTSVSINIQRDGSNVSTPNFTSNNQVIPITAVPYTQGQLLSFETNTVVGTWNDVRVIAWMRVKSTALFPTPDRKVVSNSNVSFTSTSFATIPGLSTSVTINDTGTVDAMLIYSAARSGFLNAESQFRVVINGSNGLIFRDTLSTFNDTGGASFFVSGLPAGTYTVIAQCATDQPILIASCQLTAVGVED